MWIIFAWCYKRCSSYVVSNLAFGSYSCSLCCHNCNTVLTAPAASSSFISSFISFLSVSNCMFHLKSIKCKAVETSQVAVESYSWLVTFHQWLLTFPLQRLCFFWLSTTVTYILIKCYAFGFCDISCSFIYELHRCWMFVGLISDQIILV